MNTPHDIIALAAPVEISAAKKLPTFEAVFYTGGAMQIGGWAKPVVIDLAGLKNGNLLVANLDHDTTKRVGNFEVENDGRKLIARGVASAATPARDEVVNSAKAGYRWQASLEVSPEQVEAIKAGESVKANGRTFTGPKYITRRGILKGFAFVSHGADDDTSVSIAARHKGKQSMANLPFRDFMLQFMGEQEFDDLTPAQLANCHATYCGRSDVRSEDREAVLSMIHASADPVAAEERRLRQIEGACRGDFGGSEAEVTELKARALGGELSVDKLLNEVRQVRREIQMNSIAPARAPQASRRDMNPQIIEAAFCLSGNLANIDKHYPEQVLDAAHKLYRSMSLQQLILAEAVGNGYQAVAGERVSQGNLRSVLQAAFAPVRASTGFSTMSLTTTFANVANKFMREGFDAVDQTALRIAHIKSVKDFKQNTTISLTGALDYEEVAPAGELKHGTLGEEVYTNQADTYGVMLAITRQHLINDDQDILSAVPRRIGRAGMLKLNDLLWTLFLDNASFFTSGRNNLAEAGSVLSLTGLALTEKKFINQTDPDGNPLGIMPSILLVPPSLRATALTLMNSQLTVGGDSNVPNANVWQGRFSVECSPYMENSGYTGNSALYYYLLANPNQLPVIEIAALNGNVMPTVESADADFNTLGIQCRGYSDVGVALQEYRGGVKATGAGA